MSEKVEGLDVPDGMLVTHVKTDEEKDAVTFYTGRWTIEYSVAEVEELVEELQSWAAEMRLRGRP